MESDYSMLARRMGELFQASLSGDEAAAQDAMVFTFVELAKTMRTETVLELRAVLTGELHSREHPEA